MDQPPINDLPSNEDSDSLTASVQIKTPEFNPEDLELWLAQLEHQFRQANIRSELSKYLTLSNAIPRSFAAGVRDLIINVPLHKPFTALKTALLQRTALSEEKRIHQLLEGIQLEGRTPSELLRLMRQQLEPNAVSESVLRQLWLKRLPERVKSVISIFFHKCSLDELAEGADRAMEAHPSTVHQVAATSDPSISTIMEELKELRLTVQSLQRSRSASRHRSNSRSSSSSSSRRRRSRNRTPTRESGVCWYHETYKDKARKCTLPCKFSHLLKN